MTPATSSDAGAAAGGLKRWCVVAAALLLVAVACITVGLRGHQHPLAGPVGRQVAPATVLKNSALAPSLFVVARSVPVTLRIPVIGLAVSLSELGLNPDGTVQVPTDFQQPGWFDLGPSPGQVGSAVILGHVDSYQGPAVFFQLNTLLAGDQVYVTLADGAVADFTVDTVVMYPKVGFPDSLVYASHGYSALQLVTCGGAFDTATGHYLSNIVVYTSLVSITTPAQIPAAPVSLPPESVL